MQKKRTDKHRCWRCGAPSQSVLTKENGVYKYEYGNCKTDTIDGIAAVARGSVGGRLKYADLTK